MLCVQNFESGEFRCVPHAPESWDENGWGEVNVWDLDPDTEQVACSEGHVVFEKAQGN